MVIIVCLDENGGMLFNGRRQSRDKAVAERIRGLCKGKRLWMNSYSYRLYGRMEGVEAAKDEHFLMKAGEGEMCLLETEKLKPVEGKIEKIIVFRWNRKYPADMSIDWEPDKWERVSTLEFPGVSHEKITEEVYKRDREVTV
ncbi:ribonuclease Z [Lachnospiraceae bacterium 42-17]